MFSVYYILYTIDLPGYKKEDIGISIDGGVLHVNAFKHKLHDRGEHVHFHRRERAFGRAQRSIALPSNCNPDTATCEFLNGVLIISMPKMVSSVHKKLIIA